MIVVPFRAEHLQQLQLQDAQAYCGPHITAEYAKMLEGQFSFTAMVDDRPIGVGGATELWEHRALLWSMVDRRAGPHFVAIHRAVQRFIDMLPHRRIEAEVDVDFAPGHRWVRALGFTLEAPRMRAFRVDGGDSALYARVK